MYIFLLKYKELWKKKRLNCIMEFINDNTGIRIYYFWSSSWTFQGDWSVFLNMYWNLKRCRYLGHWNRPLTHVYCRYCINKLTLSTVRWYLLHIQTTAETCNIKESFIYGYFIYTSFKNMAKMEKIMLYQICSNMIQW